MPLRRLFFIVCGSGYGLPVSLLFPFYVIAQDGNHGGNKYNEMQNEISVGLGEEIVYHPENRVEQIPEAGSGGFRLHNAERIAHRRQG